MFFFFFYRDLQTNLKKITKFGVYDMFCMTYTAHNEHGGDYQAVDPDDGHDGNPDGQIGGFF